MFEFTTQTVLNQLKLFTVGGQNNAQSASESNVIISSDPKPELRIANFRFNADDVESVQVKEATAGHKTKVTFDLSKIQTIVEGLEDTLPGLYRIALYVGLSMNSHDSYYANAFTYKGKPMYIEFTIGPNEEMADVAAKIVRIANKYMLFTADEKILNVTADGTEVTFEGTNFYQQIKKAVLQKYDPSAVQIDCCSTEGDFIALIDGVPLTWTTSNGEITVGETKFVDGEKVALATNVEVGIEPGIEAFGDYNWMIHNLRLPTLANTNFFSPTKSEMPAVGATYNQVIITLCTQRDHVAGEAVGMRVTSVTNHVFYVNSADPNLSAFMTEVEKLSTKKTDADDAFADPFVTSAGSGSEQGGNGGNNQGGNGG